MTNRVLLCIMDGWGISTGSEKYDATKLAHPVNVPELIKDYPSTKIHADGEYVGPVSYTHLDVYKRQLLHFRQQNHGRGLLEYYVF